MFSFSRLLAINILSALELFFISFLLYILAILVCFVFIVTSPILASHALTAVIAYLTVHTNFGSAQNGVFAVNRIRERICFGCDVN